MTLRFLVDYPKPNVDVKYAAGDVVSVSDPVEARDCLRGGYAEVVPEPEPAVEPSEDEDEPSA